MNAYAVYLHDFKASGAEGNPLSKKTFITRIAQQLMGPRPDSVPGTKRKAAQMEVEGEEKWVCAGEKFNVIEGEGKKQNKHGKKTRRKIDCKLCKVKCGKRKQARYECKGCGFAFHDKCFRQWHDEYVTDLEVV